MRVARNLVCPTWISFFSSTQRTIGYWIQISGASVFSVPDIKANRYGEPPEREYDDLADINAIISAIKGNSARVVDNLVLSQDALKVRTALVIGPLFYGTGSGPGNKRSVQAPEIARVTLEKKKGFKLGRGLTVWSNCHVRDLGDLFVRLLEAADGGDVKEGIWNQEGIFTPENGNLVSYCFTLPTKAQYIFISAAV